MQLLTIPTQLSEIPTRYSILIANQIGDNHNKKDKKVLSKLNLVCP